MLDQAVRLREVVNAQTTVATFGTQPHKISVVSGKGGVGKSNIALNLALALARDGARILLVDGSVNLSNLDILCGMSPSYRLFDVIDGTVRLKDAAAEISTNVFLLAGSSDGQLKRLTSSDAATFFREVRVTEPGFQYAVIDTAGGIVQESISLALLSDEVLVVSTPEPTAVMDAYVLVKAIKRINANADLKLLINRARDAAEAEVVKSKFDLVSEHFLNMKLEYAGFIPSDTSMEKAVSIQSPLFKEFPESPSSQALISIADRILSKGSFGKKK
jgi:flagellar biosynthesis protein FlhG